MLLAVFLTSVLLLGNAVTAPGPEKTPVEIFNEHVRHEARHLFQGFDYNDNGHFDSDDFPPFIQEYDTDGNGTIERAEFEEHFDMNEPTLALVANGLFFEFDTDKSGHIDLTDMAALHGRMDVNNDGTVNRDEFQDYMVEVLTILAILHVQGHEFE